TANFWGIVGRLPRLFLLKSPDVLTRTSATPSSRMFFRRGGPDPHAHTENRMNQIAYNISEVCAASRASRTTVYEAIKAGQLRAVKRGRRTLVLAVDLRSWLEGLPPVKPGLLNQNAPTPCFQPPPPPFPQPPLHRT